MSWLAWLLPLSSGVCDAASRYVIKTAKVHKFTLISAGFFFALPVYTIWLMLVGTPAIQKEFWVALGCHVPLLAWANKLTVEAHRKSPLILTMPYLGFTPAFLLGTAPLINWLMTLVGLSGAKLENPTIWGALGVLVLTIGLYVLNTQSNRIGFWAPFRAFSKEEGSRKMLLVSFIFAFTANFDYLAIKSANTPTYLLMDHGLVAIIMAAFAIWYKKMDKTNGEAISPEGHFRVLGIYGLVIAGSIVFHMLAFNWIPTVSYVIASKRAGGILFAVGLGLILGFVMKRKDFAKEKEDLKYRIPGTLIMLIGMLVIIFWGKTA